MSSCTLGYHRAEKGTGVPEGQREMTLPTIHASRHQQATPSLCPWLALHSNSADTLFLSLVINNNQFLYQAGKLFCLHYFVFIWDHYRVRTDTQMRFAGGPAEIPGGGIGWWVAELGFKSRARASPSMHVFTQECHLDTSSAPSFLVSWSLFLSGMVPRVQ